jgi:hypothetical protein
VTRDPELPRRPGEPGPDDVGKKGGDLPDDEGPIVDEPTDLPRNKPGAKEGPIKQPTI